MRVLRRNLPVLAVLLLAAACATPAQTPGERIDDGLTTATVKTKLAEDRLGTLTQIGVDTHQGIVTLTGTVEDEVLRQRAGYLTSQVRGVRSVVNNLQVKTPAGALAPPQASSAEQPWRVADPVWRGSAEELRARAAREAAAQNRSVAYERMDGSQRIEAHPLASPAPINGCRWVQQRVFENGRLVDERSSEVCG
jgi:hyperosmotically inducible protein